MAAMKKSIDTAGVLEAILRQWGWAEEMRKQFDKHKPPKSPEDTQFQETKYWLYMCLWYSLLYSLLQSLRVVDGVPQAIWQIADDAFVKSLKSFRNAIFHVQFVYWRRNKLMPLIQDNDSVEKIRRVHILCAEFLQAKVCQLTGQDSNLYDQETGYFI